MSLRQFLPYDLWIIQAGLFTTKGPSWGNQGIVLGAIGSFLSTFGENRPRFLKNLSKLTF